ncbi:MAG: Glycogen synthase [Candidatus Peregrinibacteria bacterium GW2011_GWA2_33_10]|nr:MAG: Glycogen synthase [Candidatus Peregrinibacteria bacterium GW2011_GWA2_33_10]KKP40134.1 MAG: hypothetical protein UR30_C0006G0039 [Candidatus Peregrinibacteria bacterium GW2011_GWC2_33_13]
MLLKTASSKKEQIAEFQKLFHVKKNNRPVLNIDLQYFNYDFANELEDFLKALKHLNIDIIVNPFFHKDLKKHLPNLNVYEDNLKEQALKYSDFSLFLSDDKHILNSVKSAFLNASVPVFYNFKNYSDILIDYNPVKETGNCFMFKNFNKWEIFEALIRAIENHKFSWDWQNIVREGYNAYDELERKG